jgi:hypothetical protein
MMMPVSDRASKTPPPWPTPAPGGIPEAGVPAEDRRTGRSHHSVENDLCPPP